MWQFFYGIFKNILKKFILNLINNKKSTSIINISKING